MCPYVLAAGLVVLTVLEGSVEIALALREKHLAAWNTGHWFGSGGLAVSGAVLRTNCWKLPSCIGGKANHMPALVSYCNTSATRAGACGPCLENSKGYRRGRGSVTWVGTQPGALHTGDRGPSVVEEAVAERSHRRMELVVSGRNWKLHSAFVRGLESSCPKPLLIGRLPGCMVGGRRLELRKSYGWSYYTSSCRRGLAATACVGGRTAEGCRRAGLFLLNIGVGMIRRRRARRLGWATCATLRLCANIVNRGPHRNSRAQRYSPLFQRPHSFHPASTVLVAARFLRSLSSSGSGQG